MKITNYAEQIKQSVNMTDVAEYYGIKINNSGFCCCPFHNEKTASLKIYPNKRGWYCYGRCNSGGDVIDFVRKLFDLNFIDACKRINDDFSLGLDFGKPTDTKTQSKFRLQQIQKQELEKWITAAMRDLCTIHRTFYKIIQSGDTNNPLFFSALQNIDRVSFLIDETNPKPIEKLTLSNEDYYRIYGKEVEDLRKTFLVG